MDLNELFAKQKELDEYIIKEKGLEGQDLLDKKVLALQVELGELAKNWRGFKFWSNDQEPRKGGKCNCDDGYLDVYMGDGVVEQKMCERCNGTYEVPNTLLEEYVDCLHFILSIGNDTIPETGKVERFIHPKKMPNILDQFMWTNKKIVDMYEDYRDKEIPSTDYHFTHVFSAIWGLGEMLGFTWDEIEKAYLERNKINYK